MASNIETCVTWMYCIVLYFLQPYPLISDFGLLKEETHFSPSPPPLARKRYLWGNPCWRTSQCPPIFFTVRQKRENHWKDSPVFVFIMFWVPISPLLWLKVPAATLVSHLLPPCFVVLQFVQCPHNVFFRDARFFLQKKTHSLKYVP